MTEYDNIYRRQTEEDINNIIDICEHQSYSVNITDNEVMDAISSLKRNKAPDIYNISAVNIIYGGELLQNVIIAIVKAAFRMGIVPEIFKLTPVFKNKGSNKCAVNYRGITVTPVLQQILETVANVPVKPYIREKKK